MALRDARAESDAAARGSGDGESAWLIPVAGPPLRAIELKPSAAAIFTIGRQENCNVRLPSDAVSRQHAQLRYDNGQWRLSDLKSRWGTFVNGYAVAPAVEIALHAHDLVRISPWTFNFSPRRTPARVIESIDDGDRFSTLVRSAAAAPSQPGSATAEERLAILLDCAAATHAATEERALAEAVVDAARRGSNLPNAALLRPVDIAAGHVEIIAACHPPTVRPAFSRSLLTAASNGEVAQFSPHDASDVAASMITMRVDAALCIPLMLGPTVAAYLYLDARGGAGHGAVGSLSAPEWQARSAFCLALGRIAGLALANLRRMEMERRAATLDAELRAAAEAQHWVLPHAHVELGGLRCEGQSQPGRHVGGDFFDIVPLADGRIAVALGDVAGKGIAASVLMTATAGFLHAALSEPGTRVEDAVTRVNRFVAPRRPQDRFVTLWVGVIDPAHRVLEYVDAGHGYAYLCAPEQPTLQMLDGGDNLPVGVGDTFTYTAVSVSLPAAGQLLVVSDGFIEQPAPPCANDAWNDNNGNNKNGAVVGGSVGEVSRFGIAGLWALAPSLHSAPNPLQALFAAVTKYAASPTLCDDATAVVARW